MDLTYGERDLLEEILQDHLREVERGSIVYGDREDIVETLEGLLKKMRETK